MKTSHRKTVSSPKQYLLLIFSLLSRFFTKWKGIHIIFRPLMGFCCEPDITYGRLISIVSHTVWWGVKGKTAPYRYITQVKVGCDLLLVGCDLLLVGCDLLLVGGDLLFVGCDLLLVGCDLLLVCCNLLLIGWNVWKMGQNVDFVG